MTQDAENETQRPPHKHRALKIAVAVAVILVVVGMVGKWLYFRHDHVSSEDAQVMSNEITVSSRLPGRLVSFDQRRGNPLKQGQIIAQLDPKPTQLKLQRYRHDVAEIRSRLAYEQKAIDIASQQRKGGTTQERAELASDQAAVRVAQAGNDKAEHVWKRAERLFRAGQMSAQNKDDAYFDYRSAQAALARAKRQVGVDRAALDNAELGVLSNPMMLLPDPNLLKAKLAVTRQALAAAEARVAETRNDLDDLSIRSPQDGVVDQTFTQPGQYLSAGQPILMLHRPDDVWIRAKMKETKIAKLKVGQPVAIHVDAYPDTPFKGHVAVIGHAATNQFALLPDPNPSGNFTKITQRLPVRIAIDRGPRAKLAPGMMVEVNVDVARGG